ncbi:hypothetical protein [Macrococcus carouselicus]|uniref:Uncharacterized protein n=1 Tax=Macrococcus carouselicus TaxID=69969 RepID=A0A9Q8CN76_9STAP|nr:hypothetical protein [Macrococcus carouselicus]TDM04277.1 hypothetical protein ERX40_03675 [Macrococcus carouselicus]
MLRRLLLMIIPTVFLSGCFYPTAERAENRIAPLDQLNMVQTAVDQYQKDNGGLLPLKDRDQTYDQYVKHPVDFEKLQPRYLSELPGSSFEKGGIYQYVLMDVEHDPTVKLVDLRTAEVLKDLRIRLNIQDRTLPLGEKVGPNVYRIAYKKYGLDEYPTVTSPYSGETLPVYINGGNEFIVDYTQDLGRVIKEKNLKPEAGEDIRPILYEDSPVLPAYSVPYTVNEKNEPVFKSNVLHNKK